MFQLPYSSIAPMRAEMVEIYWVLITIIVLVTVILNFFEVAEGNFNPAQIIKRAVISMILLWTFEEAINLIVGSTELIVNEIGGMSKWETIFLEMEKRMASNSPALFKFRQLIIGALNILCYITALAAYYLINVLINFTYTILYVFSPLMILAYVPASTSYITTSLYKGIFNVCSWKISWSVLGALLFKLSTVPEIQQAEGLIMQALTNLCIGVAMFKVPAFTSSLLSDGGTGFATATSSMATDYATKGAGKLLKELISPDKSKKGKGQNPMGPNENFPQSGLQPSYRNSQIQEQ